MATRKLYYENSHMRTFHARVISCVPAEKGYSVILDATCFYPEGGGQAADTGRLGNAHVLDTRECGDEIIHLCDAPLETGSMVDGAIDWEPRFLRMQQHSGEHIVSGILHRRYGVSNTGFHMGKERIVIDFSGAIPTCDLPEIEREANEAVWQNIAVKTGFPSREELPSIPYRSKKELSWPVRIVEIPGYDICACCGTHVDATGEIGLIKLYSSVPLRGGSRIEMACGAQALAYLNCVLQESVTASHVFSVPPDQVGAAAESFQAQLSAQKIRMTELQRRLSSLTAQGYAGKGNVLHFESGLDGIALRELTDAIAASCGGTAAVFSGADAEGYSYCLANRCEDIRPLGKKMADALHGRGGGKPNFQQGKVAASRAEIEAFFRGGEEKFNVYN